MPASQTPIGRCKLEVEGLGVVEGLSFPSAHQFCGIPYGSLTKRWTRSQLQSSWKDGLHDGTKLGCVLHLATKLAATETDSSIAAVHQTRRSIMAPTIP